MPDPRDRDDMFHVEHPDQGRNVVPLRSEILPNLPGRREVPYFSISEMMQIAQVIAKSGLFGSNDPNAVATLCMLAHAEGQHPAVVFRDYDIIQGKPSKKAEAMQRDFLLSGGKIKWHKLDNEGGSATFTHARAPEPVTIDWDIQRAKDAMLWDKKNRDGSPGMWKRFPRAMFRSRIVSEGVRSVWPAATSGLYETAEVIDIVSDDERQNVAMRKEGTEEEKAERRANAERFVVNLVEAIKDCATLEALDDLKKANFREVRKLGRTQGDLYAKVQVAYEEREQAIQGYDPVTGELRGEDDKPKGEPETVYESFWRRLDEARNLKEVDKIDRDWCKVRAAQSDEVVDLVDEAVAKRRRSYQGNRK